jgi:hypothetical protein
MNVKLKELSREIDINVQIQDEELIDKISQLFKDNSFNSHSLDAILYIIELILVNPYNDYYRIIDPIDYKATVFSVSEALKVLCEIGFEKGSSDLFLILPYDRNIKKLIAAKRIITARLETCFKVLHSHPLEHKGQEFVG